MAATNQPPSSLFHLTWPLFIDLAFHFLTGALNTFMVGQVSYQSVAALARFYKILPENILVVHDELDLEPGQARLKQGGGHAGHNGLRDINAQLGSPNYWRLRLGIGHPGSKPEVVNWVLKKPSSDHRIAIEQAIDRSLLAVPDILAGEMEKAMRAIHTAAL